MNIFSRQSYSECMEVPAVGRLLKKWIIVMERYIEAMNDGHDGDHPWHYRERPQIGFLSAAAWQLPSVVTLEEWGTEKAGPKSRGTKRDLNRGRSDLYIYFSRPVHLEIYIEAKHSTIDAVGSLDEQRKKVSRLLNEASDDAARMKKEENAIRAGIVFLSRHYRKGHDKNIGKDLEKWLADLHQNILPRHAMAWLMHDSNDLPSNRKMFTAGIVLIARFLDRVPRTKA